MSRDVASSSFFKSITSNKFLTGGSKFIIIEEVSANVSFSGDNSFIGVWANKARISVTGKNNTVVAYQNTGEIIAKGKDNIAKVIDSSMHGRVVVTESDPARFFGRRPAPSRQLEEPLASTQRSRPNFRRATANSNINSLEESIIENRISLGTRNENGTRMPRLRTRESLQSGLRPASRPNLNLQNNRMTRSRVLLQQLPQIAVEQMLVTPLTFTQQTTNSLRPEGSSS
jgi:hypothetical protein